jgi:translation initiation factor 2 subunit 3
LYFFFQILIYLQFKRIGILIEYIEKYIPTPERVKSEKGIMHILRSFDINKPGTPIRNIKGGVLGGALTQGEFEIGNEIEILPGILNERKSKYESIFSEIGSLATGAGLVDKVRPGGLVAIGSKLDPSFIKSDSLIGAVVGKPGSLPPVVDEITIDINLFDTAVGTQDLVKVEPIRNKENLRLNIGTAVTIGNVTNSKNQRIEVKIKKPICLMPKSRVALSRRIADRWRLIGAGITV